MLSWRKGVVISPPGESIVPQISAYNGVQRAHPTTTLVVVDRSSGNAIAAMITKASATYPDRSSIWVTSHVKGAGSWTTPQRLGYCAGSGPRMDSDDNGHFVLVWLDTADGGTATDKVLESSTYDTATGLWTPAASLVVGGDVGVVALVATKGVSAATTLAWENVTTGEVMLTTTTTLAQLSSSQWPTPTSVGAASMPAISNDLRFVAYQASTKIMIRPFANGSYGVAQIASAGTSNIAPVLAANTSGNTVLGFYSGLDFYVSKLDGTGTWNAPAVASDSVFGWGDPQLSLDSTGDGLLAIQPSEPMALVFNHSTGLWSTNPLANDGTGLTISADPVADRAAFVWVDAGRQAIKTMLLD